MKTLTHEEMLRMPKGTVFSRYEDGLYVEGLYRKGDNTESHGADTWEEQTLLACPVNGFEMILGGVMCNAPEYDDGSKYVVYEQHDLIILASMLTGQ